MRSTIVTSQLPVEKWHAVVGDPTLADAILDRLVHSAYQLNLKGVLFLAFPRGTPAGIGRFIP